MKKSPCSTGKIRHESEEDARFAIRAGMLRDSPKLYAYGCLACTGWHLTSSPPHRSPIKRKK